MLGRRGGKAGDEYMLSHEVSASKCLVLLISDRSCSFVISSEYKFDTDRQVLGAPVGYIFAKPLFVDDNSHCAI